MSETELHYHARDVAISAAQLAAALISYHAGRVPAEDIDEKRVHDLVSRIDEASQELIVGVLQKAFPGFDVLAEEGRETEATETVAGYRWIIDPIDGTTNFLHGVPPFAVSIGLQQGAEVVVGVVLDVSRGDLFTAVRGGGAYRNGVPMRVSDTDELKNSLLVTGFPYRVFDYLDSYMEVLATFMRTTRGIRRTGSAAVDLTYVACGMFDGFFETGLNAWDVAAGLLLVKEAGGEVTDFHETPSTPFDRQLVASNGAIHQALQEGLVPLREVRY